MIDDSELRERELKSELEANNPYSVDSFDSFDSPVDTFDRGYFWV